MTSIKDRLSRQDWEPDSGATLVGEIIELTQNETQYGMYPVLVLKEDDTGDIVTVHCLRGGLLRPVLRARPDVGARVGIRYDGQAVTMTGTGGAHRYVVAFENTANSAPNWDAIEKSQAERDKDSKPAGAEPDWPSAAAAELPPPGDPGF